MQNCFFDLLPHEVIATVVRWLNAPLDIIRLGRCSKLFHSGVPCSPVEDGVTQRALATGTALEHNPPLICPWEDFLRVEVMQNRSKSQVMSTATVHSVFVNSDSELLSCGNESSSYAFLGTDERELLTWYTTPTMVAGLHGLRVCYVSATSDHTVFGVDGGGVYTFGLNYSGQLGLGDYDPRRTPTRVTLLEDVRVNASLAAPRMTLFVTDLGHLYSSGLGLQDAQGHGEVDALSSPERVMSLQDVHVMAVAASCCVTLVLDRDGDVWSCGWAAVQVPSDSIFSTTVFYGSGLHTVVFQHLARDRVAVISAGGVSDHHCHFLLATTSGHLYAWGSNAYGQLGLGAASADHQLPQRVPVERCFTAVAAGNTHSLVVADGIVYSFGFGLRGVLGVGDCKTRYEPTRVHIDARVRSVAAGEFSSLAVTTGGSVYGWGEGDPLNANDMRYDMRYNSDDSDFDFSFHDEYQISSIRLPRLYPDLNLRV